MSVRDNLLGMYDASAKRLVLDTSMLGAPGASLLASTGAATLVFDGVAAPATAAMSGAISFEGRSLSLSDGSPLIAFPQDWFASASCTVFQAETDPVIVISARLSQGWKFSSAFPWLASTWWDEIAVTAAPEGAPPSALLISTGAVDEPAVGGRIAEGVAFFGSLDDDAGLLRFSKPILGKGLNGFAPITLGRTDPPTLSMSLPLNGSDAGLAGLIAGEAKIPLEAKLLFQTVSPDIVSGLHLGATLSWAGTPVKFEAVIPGVGRGIIELSIDGPLPLPTPDDLGRYLGGTSVTQFLPDSFSNALESIHVGKATLGIGAGTGRLEYARIALTTLENATLAIVPEWVEIGDIRFTVTVFDPLGALSASHSLSGTLHIGDVALLVSANLVKTPRSPVFTAVIQLDEGDVIDLSMIAEKFGLPPGAPQIVIDDLHMSASTAGTYFIAAELAEHPIGPNGNGFVLNSLNLEVDHQGEQTDVAIAGAMTIAGVGLDVAIAHSGTSWAVDAKTREGDEIDFTQLVTEVFGKFDFDLPTQIPDFKLKNLNLQYDFATRDFAFSGDSTVATKVQLGAVEHDIETRLDLKIGTDADGKRTYAGFLRGELKLGSATFQVEYDFGDASILKGSWDGTGGALQFSDLADSHGIEHSLQPPGGMPLDLKSAAFEFDVSKGKFTLSATSKYGDAFFIASNANGQWDFAFGVLVDFADIPGFPPLGTLNLNDAVLVLSTVRDDKFAVPSLPNAPSPAGQAVAAGHTFPALTAARPMRLSPGVSVAALLSFEDGGDPVLGHLGDIVGTSELLVQASFDTTAHSASFLSYLNGSLTIAGSGSKKLVLSNVFIKLEADPLAVLISGSVLVPFDHVTLEAAGALAVSQNEMEALFQIKALADGKPAALPSPFGLRGVELDELDVEVGVTFKPPGVDLGIEGKFNIGGQPPGANEFIVVLELEGEVPNPIYLSTQIQTLSIKEIVTIYSGGSVTSVPEILEALKAEDLSIYWSEAAGTVLPDGRVSQQGFGFNGILDIAGFSAHAALAVGAAGVSGDAQLPPIRWGVFSLTGTGKGVTVSQVLVDGQWQTVTKPADGSVPAPAGTTRKEQIIAPGGAVVAINSTHSPFIDVGATATLFDLISAEVEIEVTDSGFKYKQKEDVGGVFHAEFDCAVSKSGFSAHSEFDLDIKGEVGPIVILGIDFGTLSLDVGFHTLFDLSIGAPPAGSTDHPGFTLTVGGSFEFEGLSLTLPTLTLQADFNSFSQLPGKILQQIDDNAEELFKDLFDEAKKILNEAKEEAEKIAHGITDATDAVAHEAEVACDEVAAGARAAADALAGEAAEAEAKAKEVADEAAKVAQKAAADAQAILDAAAIEAKLLEQGAEAVVAAAAAEAKQIEAAVADEVLQIAADAEHVWNAAQAEAQEIARAAEAAFNDAVNAAVAAGEAALHEAEAAAAAVEQEAAAIAGQVEQKLAEAARWAEEAAESAWNAVKKY